MENMKKANELITKAIMESEEKGLEVKETFKDLEIVNVLQIVNYWYNNLTPDIFQNEEGADLEEYVERELDMQ